MNTKLCQYCHKIKPRDQFPKIGAKCKQCCKEFRLAHREEINADKRTSYQRNRSSCLKKRKEYYESNKEIIIKQIHENTDYHERKQRTFRRWMYKSLSSARCQDRIKHRPFDIDMNYVMGILEKQGFKCAITGMPMEHRFNNLRSASIDRIDNAKGHVRGNIQIICIGINKMKGAMTDDAAREFLDSYYHIRRAREADVSDIDVDKIVADAKAMGDRIDAIQRPDHQAMNEPFTI